MGELRTKQKAEALRRMKKLNIMKRVIAEFEKEEKVNVSDLYGALYWLSDEQKTVVRRFEEESGGLVYHVIRSRSDFGEILSLLFVGKDTSEWEADFNDLERNQVFVYVENLTDPELSEYGAIGITGAYGGLVRTW